MPTTSPPVLSPLMLRPESFSIGDDEPARPGDGGPAASRYDAHGSRTIAATTPGRAVREWGTATGALGAGVASSGSGRPRLDAAVPPRFHRPFRFCPGGMGRPGRRLATELAVEGRLQWLSMVPVRTTLEARDGSAHTVPTARPAAPGPHHPGRSAARAVADRPGSVAAPVVPVRLLRVLVVGGLGREFGTAGSACGGVRLLGEPAAIWADPVRPAN